MPNEPLYETEKKKMSVEERADLSADLAKADRTLIELKEEKADVSRAYRVRVRELEEKIDSLSGQLDEGVMISRFEVEETLDDVRMMVEVTRKDTGQRITTRQMTEVEKEGARKRKQKNLFDENGKPLTAKMSSLAEHAAKKKNGKAKVSKNHKTTEAD